MISRLMDFSLVLVFLKVYKNIGISKIEFFNFFGTERINTFYVTNFRFPLGMSNIQAIQGIEY